MVKNIIFLFIDGVLTCSVSEFPMVFIYVKSWQQKHMTIQSIIIFLKFRLHIQWFIQSLGDLKDQAPRCPKPQRCLCLVGARSILNLCGQTWASGIDWGLMNPTKTTRNPEIQVESKHQKTHITWFDMIWSFWSSFQDPLDPLTESFTQNHFEMFPWFSQWIGLLGKNFRKTPWSSWENRWFPVKIFP